MHWIDSAILRTIFLRQSAVDPDAPMHDKVVALSAPLLGWSGVRPTYHRRTLISTPRYRAGKDILDNAVARLIREGFVLREGEGWIILTDKGVKVAREMKVDPARELRETAAHIAQFKPPSQVVESDIGTVFPRPIIKHMLSALLLQKREEGYNLTLWGREMAKEVVVPPDTSVRMTLDQLCAAIRKGRDPVDLGGPVGGPYIVSFNERIGVVAA